jgi:hypothetical protein
MIDRDSFSRVEDQRITLQYTYDSGGSARFMISCDGICYDVSDREFRLLQWGRHPFELGLLPARSRT